MERIRAAVFDSGPLKTPFVAVAGWLSSWSVAKGLLEAVILAATALIVLIHLSNALVRQWCPVRRQRVDECEKCWFCRSVLCARSTGEKEDE
jgi:hypothetical protein